MTKRNVKRLLKAIDPHLNRERQALASGEDLGPNGTWDLVEFAEARAITADLGCIWDFTSWADAARAAQSGKLGGV